MHGSNMERDVKKEKSGLIRTFVARFSNGASKTHNPASGQELTSSRYYHKAGNCWQDGDHILQYSGSIPQ